MRTAKFDTEAYRKTWLVQHAGMERYGYSKFKTALDAQTDPVVSHVKKYGGITKEMADMLVTKAPMETAYKTVYVRVGMQAAANTLRFVNSVASKKSLPGFFSEQWRKLMEAFYNDQSASRVSDVTETTREKIRQVLADSQDLPISQQATYITDTLGANDFNRNRALMIARTESTTAANFGALQGGLSSDYETRKQWLAVLDNNTRIDHADANGQTVGMDDTFEVGSSLMQYPGDMSAPANQVCNCRCNLVIVPMLSASGLPILKDVA
jgi:uncharacterized protein with gpF-like domain